jgi:hypothetical protein
VATTSIEEHTVGTGLAIAIGQGIEQLQSFLEAAAAASERELMVPPRPASQALAPRGDAEHHARRASLALQTRGTPTCLRRRPVRLLAVPRLDRERVRASALRRRSTAQLPIRSRHTVRRRRSARRGRTTTAARGSPSSGDGDAGRSSRTRTTPHLGGAR